MDTQRSELDGLRALAVIAVILNHFDKALLPSGYLGVDIFVVISGFVITTSLVNRKQLLSGLPGRILHTPDQASGPGSGHQYSDNQCSCLLVRSRIRVFSTSRAECPCRIFEYCSL